MDIKQEDRTLYVLNTQDTNHWWATVQPGLDDHGKRISDDECRRIATTLAAVRVPLTDDALDDLRHEHAWRFERATLKEFRMLARLIEQAHGIKPPNAKVCGPSGSAALPGSA